MALLTSMLKTNATLESLTFDRLEVSDNENDNNISVELTKKLKNSKGDNLAKFQNCLSQKN